MFNNKQILFSFLKAAILFIIVNLWFIVPFIQTNLSDKLSMPITTKSDLPFLMNITEQFLYIFKKFPLIFTFIPVKIKDICSISIMSLLAFLYLTVYKIVSCKKKTTQDDSNEKIITYFFSIFIFNLIVCTGIFTCCLLAKISFIQDLFIIQQFEYRELGRGLPLLFMAFSYVFCKTFKNEKIRIALCIIVPCIPLAFYYRFFPENFTKMDTCIKYCNSDYLVKNIFEGNDKTIILHDNHYTLPEDIFDGQAHTNTEKCIISDEKKGYLSHKIDYENNTNDNTENKVMINFPFFRYYGFKVFNKKGKELKLAKGEYNQVAVEVKDASGTLTAKYVTPMHWLICDIVSLIAVITLLILYFIQYKKLISQQNMN